MSKVCTKCNIEKTIDEYNKQGKKKNGDIKYSSHCKACKKQYRGNNKEHIKQYHKQYNEKNKEHIKIQNKQYYEEHKEQIKQYQKQHYEQNKEQICIKSKQYREQNKEYYKQYQKQYQRYKRATDLEFKLKDNIRRRINCAIRSQLNNGVTKSARTHELLGIPMDKYVRWIEFQLKDGWTWDDWGTKFEIDHIYPIAKYDLSKKEEQFKVFNWKNTRPICKKENRSKSDKIIPGEVFQHKVVALAFLFREKLFFN